MKKLILFSTILFTLCVNAHAIVYAQLDLSWQHGVGISGGTPNTTYTYSFTQTGGSGQLQFSSTSISGPWTSSTLNVVVNTDGSGNGSTPAWIKATSLGPADFQVCQVGGTCFSTINYHVFTISSLEFVEINSDLDTNPNTGGGDRIYPDWQSPGDGTNRKKVRVRATLSTATTGLHVSFKSFDVDDPSASNDAVDPDGGTGAGGDNRAASNKEGKLSHVGTSGTTNTLTVTSNSSGISEADFEVTMHPGDNFMVAASANPTVIGDLRVDGITLEDSGNNTLPLTTVKNTPMLTVWRKLHLEVDKMGTPSGNRGENAVSAAWPASGQSILTTYYDFPNGQYENGRINILGDSFDVESNYGDSPDYVVVNAELDPIWEYSEQEFTIWDDDDYNNNDSPNVGDNAETGPIAPLDALDKVVNTGTYAANVFAPAYITPVNDGGGDIDNNNTTTHYLNATEANVISTFGAKYDSTADRTDNFWIAYMVWGYQPVVTLDNDPVSENTQLGLTYSTVDLDGDIGAGCASEPEGGDISMVFQEATRDAWVERGGTLDNLAAPHELGHQLGLPDRAGSYLMGPTNVNNTAFHPNELHIIRCRVHSPGKSS